MRIFRRFSHKKPHICKSITRESFSVWLKAKNFSPHNFPSSSSSHPKNKKKRAKHPTGKRDFFSIPTLFPDKKLLSFCMASPSPMPDTRIRKVSKRQTEITFKHEPASYPLHIVPGKRHENPLFSHTPAPVPEKPNLSSL